MSAHISDLHVSLGCTSHLRACCIPGWAASRSSLRPRRDSAGDTPGDDREHSDDWRSGTHLVPPMAWLARPRPALTAFTAGLIVAAVLLPFVTWGADAGRGLGRRRAHCPCGHLIDHHPGRQLTGPAVGCPRRRDRRLSQSAAGRGQCRQPPGGRLRASPCGAAQRRTAGAADRRRGADRRAVVDCDRRPRPPQTPAIAAASAPIRLPSTRPSPAGCSSTAHSSTSGALPGRTTGFANRCPPEHGHRLPPS